MSTRHIPVLLDEVLEYLKPAAGQRFLDGTLGGGGHTRAILQASAPTGRVLALDRDPHVQEKLSAEVKEFAGRLVIEQASYEDAPAFMRALGWLDCQGILLDLGLSSDQLSAPKRGFSYQALGPLDLRFDQTSGRSAAQRLQGWTDAELATILTRYGELRAVRSLVRRIRDFQKDQPLETTADLRAATGLRHPQRLAQLFQAIRIATNDELGTLERALPKLLTVLAPAGRLAIISFHSGEDRIVKRMFRAWAANDKVTILTKKPVTARPRELKINPRAGSAKLRVIQKNESVKGKAYRLSLH